MAARPPRRGPGDTTPPPPLARTILGTARPVPDSEHYDDASRGSLPPIGHPPDTFGPVTPRNHNNYRIIVVTLTNRLPIAFGWLVGDAEWAMGIARGAHGGEWGEFFHRSGA